jgi:hypothetical protein
MASNGRRKGVPSGASVPASLTSRSQSLPQLQTASSHHASAVSLSSSSTEYASGGISTVATTATKCRGDFCRVAPSSLRGLYGTHPGQDMTEEPEGHESGDSTDEAVQSRGVSRDRDVALPDDGRRFKIGNNNVLLAKAEMAFIVAAASSGVKGTGTADDRMLQWQEADNVHRMELGRSNPSAFYKQVSVCHNCHSIYSDLTRFRDRGFRWAGNATQQKCAWTAAAQDDGTKKKKIAGERSRVARKDVLLALPEDDAALHYDKLFLEELAKQEEVVENPDQRRQQMDSCARSEKEVETGKRQTSADTLPVLSSSGSNVVKKKKSTNMPLQLLERDDLLSNQQQISIKAGTHNPEDNAIARLESVIQQLRQELANEQATVKRVEAQRQLLEHKVAKHHRDMQDKEDSFRKQLLQAELEKAMQPVSGSPPPPNSSSDVGELIETIDTLNRQLYEANDASENMRRVLLQSHQEELKHVHEKYQLEMEGRRLSEYAAKEQTEAAHAQMNQWQHEAQVAIAQAKSARAALDELNKTRVPQLEEKNQRLEQQLAEQLKAKSTNATTSLASSAKTSTSVQDIAAMEKHLTNKIDYLKAQLASEIKCKEELGSHLAGITASMEVLKKDKRQALADQEEAHKRHLERLAANMAQEKDVLTTQLASLQGKITTLQANVTDLVQELTMWKSREANTKLAVEKMAEENVRLTRQIVDLEGQLEALQDERMRDGSMGVKNANDETQRMQMEALLRRLDNERQYLKNQVDNEAEMKIQSQRKVQALEEELREMKVTADELTKMADHKIRTLQTEKSQVERQLRDDKSALEESKLLLTRQLKDSQMKCLQTREQLLLDKDELEKARIESSDARSQLIAAREELLKEKEYGKTANERMSKALTTIKASLKAMEDEKNLRISRLDEENKAYLQKLAKTQGELLVLETKCSEDKQATRRQHALARFVSVVSTKLENRFIVAKANAFRRLYSFFTMTMLKDTMMASFNEEMTERESEMRQGFIEKFDELTRSLHAERAEVLAQADAIRVREKEELQLYHEQERSQLEEDLQHIQTRRMQELEDHYEETLRAVDKQSAAALSALQARCDELEQERNEARTAVTEMRTRWEEVGATVEAKQQIALAELVTQQRLWEEEKKSIVDRHAQDLFDIENETKRRRREQDEVHKTTTRHALQEANERHTKEMDRICAELERQHAETAERMHSEYSQELQALQDSHGRVLEQEKQQAMERLHSELEQERAKHEEALKSALARVELKTQGHLESLQKDMNDRKANALLQCTAKWQQAMDDLQARLEIEKKVAYESGLQDRENEWQQAALQIKYKQKEELENVQNEAVRAIQAAEERHRMLLQSQVALMRKELDEKQRLEIEVLREDIITGETARSHREREMALKDQEAALRSQFHDEVELLREQLIADHSADMKGLEEKWIREREELEEWHEQERLAGMKQVEGVWATKTEQLRAEKASELSFKLAQQEQMLLKQLEEARRELNEAFRGELDAKLKAQEERLLNDQEDAISQVQEDSERLIEQVEVAMGELKKQKEALETELSRLRTALEQAEDAHFDMEEVLKKQQKSMAFQFMVASMHAKKALATGTQLHTTQMMELQSKHDRLDAMLERDKRQWERDTTQVRETWSQVQSRHSEMLQTLTNYKRDELVAHRSASAVLSNEVCIVMKQMDEVTEMKVTLEKEIEQLQTEAHGVEVSLRQLISSSSSGLSVSGGGDGSLNMAVVAKKRRLNEEFEALLEHVERKKSEVRNIDKTLASLRQRREEKESELKAMERKLVEILIGQQKQLLVLLNATREIVLPIAMAGVTAS